MERNKDLDLAYVKNRLEKYDDLVQYYSILCTKQQMDDATMKPNDWWQLARVQFQKEMKKNSVAHRRDEATYRRHLFAFKKVFLDFIY
jgi:hypothetical protein